MRQTSCVILTNAAEDHYLAVNKEHICFCELRPALYLKLTAGFYRQKD
jgi:hypothetical protein